MRAVPRSRRNKFLRVAGFRCFVSDETVGKYEGHISGSDVYFVIWRWVIGCVRSSLLCHVHHSKSYIFCERGRRFSSLNCPWMRFVCNDFFVLLPPDRSSSNSDYLSCASFIGPGVNNLSWARSRLYFFFRGEFTFPFIGNFKNGMTFIIHKRKELFGNTSVLC